MYHGTGNRYIIVAGSNACSDIVSNFKMALDEEIVNLFFVY